MASYTTIKLSFQNPVATITLHRPDVHNAINLEMIREIRRAIDSLEKDPDVRIILLRSSGAHFSAGADLNWMKQGMDQSEQQLKEESLELAGLFETIYACPMVTVAAVHGKAIGGAVGLVAASDIAIADDTALFAFAEVRLGLIPATIAPYIHRKIGSSRSRELMLTGRTFDAIEAYEAGLVHRLCKPDGLDRSLEELTGLLQAGGGEAMTGIKELMRYLEGHPDARNLPEKTAGLIAKFRTSEEGQEGMNAFLEKRRARWMNQKKTE